MMYQTPKIFGQLKPLAPADPNSVPDLIYTVPEGARAQVTMFVCNQDADVDTFRIALVQRNQTLSSARYIAWDTPLIGNGVFSVSGIGLNSGDSIRIRSERGQLSFTATGMEFS